MKNWVSEGIASDVNDFTLQPIELHPNSLSIPLNKLPCLNQRHWITGEDQGNGES